MDGFEVLEQLKAEPLLRDIPVIVLSASDQLDHVVKCIQKGAQDYLTKPFNPVLLQARIGSCLERKRLRDQETLYLRQIEEEKQRSDELLHVILPRDIAAELKATDAVKPRRFEKVGILFCDIVEFTAYSARRGPEEILSHLQTLVEAFEQLCLKHDLEKIKTIGDSFMATAGLVTTTGQSSTKLREVRLRDGGRCTGVAGAMASARWRSCRARDRRSRGAQKISI